MASDDACELRVILLVSTSEDAALANAVCESLLSEFQVANASVRSSKTSFIRVHPLSATDDHDDASLTLWVVLYSSNKSCHQVLPGMNEWMDPVLEIDTTDEATKTADDISLIIAKFCSLNSNAVARKALRAAIIARRQVRLVDDAQLHTQSPQYQKAIAHCYDESRQISGDGITNAVLQEKRRVGKVRDRYEGDQYLALVTTDRQSGFDRQLARVPFKGAVLNLTSAYWFEKTAHIIPNHLVAVPHPNVSIVKKCKPFPIEFVVRYVDNRESRYGDDLV